MSDDETSLPKLWVTSFTPRAVRQLSDGIDRLVLAGAPFVSIYVDSYGGSTHALSAMIDLIDACPLPVTTVAIGAAMSAGADLLAAGTKGGRFAAPNARIMVHESAGRVGGKMREIEADYASMKADDARLMHLLDANCGQKRGYWCKQIAKAGHANIYLSAREAKAHGIVDHVGLPKLQRISTVAIAK